MKIKIEKIFCACLMIPASSVYAMNQEYLLISTKCVGVFSEKSRYRLKVNERKTEENEVTNSSGNTGVSPLPPHLSSSIID